MGSMRLKHRLRRWLFLRLHTFSTFLSCVFEERPFPNHALLVPEMNTPVLLHDCNWAFLPPTPQTIPGTSDAAYCIIMDKDEHTQLFNRATPSSEAHDLSTTRLRALQRCDVGLACLAIERSNGIITIPGDLLATHLPYFICLMPVEVRTPTVPSSHMVGFVRACSSCRSNRSYS